MSSFICPECGIGDVMIELALGMEASGPRNLPQTLVRFNSTASCRPLQPFGRSLWRTGWCSWMASPVESSLGLRCTSVETATTASEATTSLLQLDQELGYRHASGQLNVSDMRVVALFHMVASWFIAQLAGTAGQRKGSSAPRTRPIAVVERPGRSPRTS